jgi:hypothetical protein
MDGDVREKLRETRLFASPDRLVINTADATVSASEEDGEEDETSSSTDQDQHQESAVVESIDLTTTNDDNVVADASDEVRPIVSTINIELPDARPRPIRPHEEQMPAPPPSSPVPTKEYDLDQFLASEPPAKRHGPQFTRDIRATIESLTAAVEEDNKQVEQCLEALAKARYAYTACLSKRTEHANELTMFTQLKRMIEYLSPETHPHNGGAAAAAAPATTNST